MVKIPDELARAIQSGDCVLWVGAGFGALAGRPSWEQLLRRLVTHLPRGRPRGARRSDRAGPAAHGADLRASPLRRRAAGASCSRRSAPRARARDAGRGRRASSPACPGAPASRPPTPIVVERIFAGAGGHKPEVISHLDVHYLSLRDRAGLLHPAHAADRPRDAGRWRVLRSGRGGRRARARSSSSASSPTIPI